MNFEKRFDQAIIGFGLTLYPANQSRNMTFEI